MPSDSHGVHVRPVEPREIEAVGTLLGICFEEESWSAALVEVLDDPAARRRFLRATSTNDARGFALRGSALIVDAWESHSLPTLRPDFDGLPAGAILFDTGGTLTVEDYDTLWQESLRCGYLTLTDPEVERVKQRITQLDAAEGDIWCATMYPDGYAYICMVGVNPRYQGQGVLSALFKPVIELARQSNLPLCLECYSKHSSTNAPRNGTRLTEIYAHQGFDLIETEEWSEIGLTQFRMVRPVTKL